MPTLVHALLLSTILGVYLRVPEVFADPVTYNIVAVKAPRYGDTDPTVWQEVAFPGVLEPGQDLVLIRPDGSEETLVECASRGCSVVDPVMSLDGTSVYYSYYPDLRPQGINSQRGLPKAGADIFRMDLATRQTVRLTHQEFTPNSGIAPWASDPLNSGNESGRYRLGYGILNLGPAVVPGAIPGSERIVFSSNRNGFVPARGLTNPNLQLFIMDSDGSNVRQIGHFNLGSAIHATALADGRVMFTSSEGQGNRDERVWGLWSVYPDGRNFEPLMSAFADAASFHFQTQLTNGDIAVTEYYNLNNNGFGTILAFSSQRATQGPSFGSPKAADASNPQVRRGFWYFQPGHPSHQQPRYKQYPFSPLGLRNLTAFSHGEDEASSRLPNGTFGGKVTHPSGAPGNDLLLVYSPGPVNDLERPTVVPRALGGIYLLKNSTPIDDPGALILIKRDPNFNYQQPRAVVSYKAIYGVDAPVRIPYLPDGGTPFGLVGSASFYNRNTAPGVGTAAYDGLDPFNTAENYSSTNWVTQGADAGKYSNADIHAVRILAMEPTSHLSYGPDGYEHTRSFRDFAGERLRVLGEIPLRKFRSDGTQEQDGDGNNDTSFVAKIPADVPFTFQTIDKDGLVLNMSQTWHQVRPGEVRTDCGGCHAHSNSPTDFSKTAAGRPGYSPVDLTETLILLTKDGAGKPTTASYTGDSRVSRMNVEYLRDIKPIFQRSCAPCHTAKGGATPAAGLNLDDDTISNGFDGTYRCLTSDTDARCGIKPVISSKTWRQTNASRWVRRFQSRRSLLAWKVFGRRLDGWSNTDHPTETTPGDASTLPPGANSNEADIDFTGTIMPPPGSNVPALSTDEMMTIARWIDLGAPSDSSGSDKSLSGWFVDDLRPTLNVSWPRGERIASLGKIEVAAFDYYSGLKAGSLSVKADFTVDGAAPGTDLGSRFLSTGVGTWRLDLGEIITDLAVGTVTVEISDVRGNVARESVRFAVSANGGIPEPVPTLTPPAGPTPPGGGNGGSKTPVLKLPRRLNGQVGEQVEVRLQGTNLGKKFAPIRFSGSGLPPGLKITKGGMLRGVLKKSGTWTLTVSAANKNGTGLPASMRMRIRTPSS